MDDKVVNLFEAPPEPEHHETAEAELERLRALTVDKLALEFLGVRDHLDEERAKWNALEADLKGRLTTMMMVMREKADTAGVDSFSIRGVGTAYRSTKTSYRIGDWPAFIEWVDRTKNFQCLEKRVAKLATAEIERDVGAVPPGVDKNVEVEFHVRRLKA